MFTGGITSGNESELLTEENLDTYIQEYNTVDISSQKELTDFCNNVSDILDNSDDWEKRIVAVSCYHLNILTFHIDIIYTDRNKKSFPHL